MSDDDNRHNQYAPPGASVADPAPAYPNPPPVVRMACWLIVASLALGFVTLLPGVRVPPPDEVETPALVLAGVIAFFCALTLWFVVATWRGRHWGRWALLGYMLFGWIFGLQTFMDDVSRSPISASIDAATAFLELAACVLLFIGPGGRWFTMLALQRRRQARHASD